MVWKLSSLFLAILLAQNEAGSFHTDASAPPREDAELRETLDSYFARRASEGFSGEILLTREGRTIFHQSYGVSGCDGAAIRSGGVYLIGSLVKDYTKLAVFVLAGEGRLSLDSPITDYLDELPETFQQITVRMLVEHTSGLPDVIDANSQAIEYTTAWDYESVTKGEMLLRASRVELLFVPGTERHYSNLGYSLLALMIEEVSAGPFEAFVRANVFLPLGMTNTGYVLADTAGLQLIDGCLSGDEWALPTVGDQWMEDGPSWNLRGNGGMLGTVADIERWLGAFSETSLIGGDHREDYLATTIGVSRTFGSRAVGAGGSNGVYNAYYLRLLQHETNLIMVSNNSDHPVESYRDDLFEILLPRLADR